VKTALAIFVKTPGHSSVKTRLAATTGREFAEEFYSLSVEAIEELGNAAFRSIPGLVPHWAVAESEAVADPRWSGFAVVDQGSGDLGTRLDRVHQALIGKFDRVLLIGADSPQLTVGHLRASIEALEKGADFCIGPAKDGGYHLFASRKTIPPDVWMRVPYSCARTASEFVRLLAPIGEVATGEVLGDVDEEADLESLRLDLGQLDRPTPAQSRIFDFLGKARSFRANPAGT